MNTDIRLRFGFLDHPKTVKLKRRHGADAVLCLIRVWQYVAQNKPTGDLSGMDAEDIDIACGAHTFSMHEAMLEVGFLDRVEGGFSVHDWHEEQAWASKAPERKASAKRAAEARWEKKQQVKAQPMLSACAEHAESNAPILSSPILSLPENQPTTPPEKEVVSDSLSFDEVRNLYRDVFRDLLPSTTVCQQLGWISETFDRQTILDAFTGASSVKAKSINYIIKPLREKLERKAADDAMWAEMEKLEVAN